MFNNQGIDSSELIMSLINSHWLTSDCFISLAQKSVFMEQDLAIKGK